MSQFKQRMIVKYFLPGDYEAGRGATFSYLLFAKPHPVDGFTVELASMNSVPAQGELPAGKMRIRQTSDVETAFLGAQAQMNSHHAGFKAIASIPDTRISREAFDNAQVDGSPSGSGLRKQIDDALDAGDPVIITEPDGDESKVGRDDEGKFTFTPIDQG